MIFLGKRLLHDLRNYITATLLPDSKRRRKQQVAVQAAPRFECLEDRLTPASNFLADPALYQVQAEAPVLSRLARFVPSAIPSVSNWVTVSAADANLDPNANGGHTNIYVIAHGWAPGFKQMVLANGTATDPLKWWETLDTSLAQSPGTPASPEMFYGSAGDGTQISPTGLAYALSQADPKSVILAYSWIDESATDDLLNSIPDDAYLSEAYTTLNGERLANAMELALPTTFNANGGALHLIGHSHGSKVATVATLALDQTANANYHVKHLTILDSPEVASSLVNIDNAANNLWYFMGGFDTSHGNPSANQTFVDNYISELDTRFGVIQGVNPFNTTQTNGNLQNVVDVSLNGRVLYDFFDIGDLHGYSFNWYGGGSLSWAQNANATVADQWSPLVNPANIPTNGSYSQTWTTSTQNQFQLTAGPANNTVTHTPTFTNVGFGNFSLTQGSSFNTTTGSLTLTENGTSNATFIGEFMPQADLDGVSFQYQFTNVGQGDQLVISADTGLFSGYRIAFVMTGTVAGTNSGVGTLTLTSLAGNTNPHHIKIQLMPAANSTGASVTISQMQQFATGLALNAAPVNHTPANQTVVVGSSMQFSQANGNAITVSDVDAGSGNVSVNLAASDGTLAVAVNWGVQLTGYGTSNLTLTGPLQTVNKTLDTLFYQAYRTNGNIAPGNVTLTIRTNDNGNTGTGGAKTDTDVITLVAQAPAAHVNIAPAATVPIANQSITPAVPFAFKDAAGNALRVGDIDAGYGNVQLTLSAVQGRINFGTTVGMTFVSANNSSNVVVRGRVDHINYNLQSVTYVGFNSFSGADSLTVKIEDLGNTGTGGNKSDTKTVNLVGTPLPVNQAPVNTVPAGQVAVAGKSLLFSAVNGNAISTADPDAGSRTISVNLKVNTGTLAIAVAYGNVAFTGYGTNNLTLTGSSDSLNKTLGTLFYQAGASAGADTLTITTNDLGNFGSGGAKTDVDTVAINVQTLAAHVNVAPTITAPLARQNATMNGTFAFNSGRNNLIAVGDLDAGYDNVQVTLTVAHGKLAVTPLGAGGPTVTGNGTGTLTLMGRIDHIDYILQSLLYIPTTGYAGADTLAVTINDQGRNGTGGAKQANQNVNIQVA